jgi:hypothetical protein
MSAPTSAAIDDKFTIKAGADDGNNNGILVSIKKPDGSIVAQEATVNGLATFKVTEKDVKDTGKKYDFTITATMDGYTPADEITIEIQPKSPGFELITLVIALGVALILLKRRRK